MGMLTEAGIKAAIRHAPASGRAQTVIKDAGPRGAGRLALIVRPLATRVASEWYAIYFRQGRKRLTKIGAYPDVTLADAREKFRSEYAPTILTGAEPKNKFARRANRRHGRSVTVAELFEAYIKHLKKQDKSASYQAERILLKREDNVARIIGADRLACDIVSDDIMPALAEIHARGRVAMAHAMRSWVHSAFAFGIKAENDYTRQLGAAKWGIKHNPASAIPTDPNASCPSNRYLSPAEIRTFWRWCEQNEHRSNLCIALRLMMATGQRVQEIVRMREQGYFVAEGIYEWSTTKNGLPHSIPLPRQAVEILATIRANAEGLYFPKRNAPKVPALYTGPNKQVHLYVAETGALPFIPRDIRRTWKTLSGRAGLSKEIRDRLQNHVKGDISSRHYDRYDYISEKRAGMKAWEAFLDGALSGKIND
jgi:integrase